MHHDTLEVLAPERADSAIDEAQVLGSAVWLWMHSAAHRDAPLHSLSTLLLPAIKRRQFILISEAGQPVFFMSWLNLSAEAENRNSGRAGRDGTSAECLLLWQKRDTALLAHFISEISDLNEQNRAWERYRVIRDFAESRTCRHQCISRHFGETPKWASCSSCDVCGYRPAWLKQAAQADSELKADPKTPAHRSGRKPPMLRPDAI